MLRALRGRRTPVRAIAILAGLLLIAGLPAAASGATFSMGLSRITSHTFSAPTALANAGDRSARLFVVEQRGTIRVVKSGRVQSGYFLDIRSLVEDGGERGLLGLAFDPAFASNGHLYVIYTRNGGDVVLARFTTNSTRTVVVASTRRTLLVAEHSARSNHNGGGIAFGPDGYLYLTIGDGGGSGDPENDAQRVSRNFLGKILRIDVRGSGAGPYGRYGIPPTNPFTGGSAGLDEIWGYGLRNPWRISFDRGTGDLFIADVGQSRREEINREPAGSTGKRNYGWSVLEGSLCYDPAPCDLAGDTLPVAQYSHANGNCSITGGYVYRGTAYPNLVGHYVFADFCSGRIMTIPHDGGTADLVVRRDTSAQITSFGETQGGELYAVTIDGKLYRVTAW